jgi:hypothetical protein
MKKQKRYFKIREKATGLFSEGGEEPRFSYNGKIWNGITAFKLHIYQWVNCMLPKKVAYIRRTWDAKGLFETFPIEVAGFLKDYEVVEYDLVEKHTVSGEDFNKI